MAAFTIESSVNVTMADSATSTPAPATTTPKKSKAAASKKPRAKPAHPPTSDMVNAAIKNLKERGGSSLQAIKKYIAANYKVDAEKLAPFIRKYLKSAVVAGTLTQPKGKGASGSFKLSVKGESKSTAPGKKEVKKPAAAKPKGEKKAKATAAKRTAKKPAAAKPKVAKPAKSPKAKKVSKPPTKKPKSPKPKKAAVKKPKTPKKTAAKKK